MENLQAILAGLGAILGRFGAGWEAKNVEFPLVFQRFLQNQCFEQKWSSWLVLSPSWGDLGASWSDFGASWDALGETWGGLGAVLGGLGRSWAGLGSVLGRKIGLGSLLDRS